MRKSSSTQTEPSQRMLRVGEEIRHILSETLRRGSFTDEILYESAHTVNVTQVKVSPDLKLATAYILGLGGADLTDILTSLNDQAHIFQQDINKGLKMKFTPKVRFREDDSYDRVGRIEEILHKISREK
jgi:ribosome-binding factor A